MIPRSGFVHRIARVASASFAILALAGCQVDLSTTVTVGQNGSGSIMVTARVDAVTVAAAPELATSLNLDDLRAAWPARTMLGTRGRL